MVDRIDRLGQLVSIDPEYEDAADLLDLEERRLKLLVDDQVVRFIDALPKLPNGKIEKFKLRAPLWAGRERAV